MTPSSADPREPERRVRDDRNGAESSRRHGRARSPDGRKADRSSRRSKDWRRDRPSGSFQRDGSQNRSGGYVRSSGREDHTHNNGSSDKPRHVHENSRAPFEAAHVDAGWGNKGKERAKDDFVSSQASASLASRLDARDPEPRHNDKRIGEDGSEDEEARERRIRRLKRRRRSAGLDSDVEEEELLAFEKEQMERVGHSRDRVGLTDARVEERRDAKRETSPRHSDRGVTRQRDDVAAGRGPQMWPRRDGDRSINNTERNRDRWSSSHTAERHKRTDRRRDEGRDSRGDDFARQRKVGRASPTPTDGSRSDYGSSRVGANGGDTRKDTKGGQSPDARILRRRRTRSRSPEQQITASAGDGRDGVSDTLQRSGGNGNGEVNTHQAAVDAAADSAASTALTSTRARPDEIYERIAQVGEGTYGQVFKAKGSRTGVIVALKKIRMESEKDGFPITAMREVKLLQGLRHENVVRLHEMMLSKNSIYMVFEYLQHDLNGVLAQASIDFTAAHLKSLAAQLLAGLAYLHSHSVLHRDLKCSNLLLNNEGTLKLADFGLARSYTKQGRGPRKRTLDYTNRVVTLWYRAPELLFGETSYGDAIDVWGAGCIFLELFARKAVFQGNDEIHQVQLLFELLGPVQPGEWPEADSLPWYNLVRPPAPTSSKEGMNKKERLAVLLGNTLPEDASDVAVALLAYNPRARLSAHDALRLPYFTTNTPHAQKPASLLQAVEGEWHEFESRRARRNAAAQALHAHVHREREEQQKDAAVAATAVSIAATSAEAMQEGEAAQVVDARAESVHLTPLLDRQKDIEMDDSGASA